jgi:hypothetical protein
MENTTQIIPLGRHLRAIMIESKINIEAQNFANKLFEAAKNGLGHMKFEDLREELPTMIMNETVWTWLKDNELRFTGSVNQNTGAYEYVISWE